MIKILKSSLYLFVLQNTKEQDLISKKEQKVFRDYKRKLEKLAKDQNLIRFAFFVYFNLIYFFILPDISCFYKFFLFDILK